MKLISLIFLISLSSEEANGQFFSDTEKKYFIRDGSNDLRKNLSIAEQKEVYSALRKLEKQAAERAKQIHPVKIHQTPEQRLERQRRATTASKTLMRNYRKKLAAEHRIEDTYLKQIEAAGIASNWPPGSLP